MTFWEWLRSPDPISDAIRNALISVFDAVSRFFDDLFQAEIHIEDNCRILHDNFLKLSQNVPRQIKRVKDFKFDPKWSSRVINVPIAINQMRDLFELVTKGWAERIDTFRDPIHEFILVFKAEREQASNDPQGRVSGLSKAAVKLDEIATLVAQLAKASDTLVEIDQMFDEVVDFFEKLDQVFLQQKNKRKTLTDHDPRVRVGKLHS